MTDQPDLLGPLHVLAKTALSLWDLPKQATARLINVSENTTYFVSAPNGFRAILRIHREGYHTRRAIECELAWLAALDRDRVVPTPSVFTGRNGDTLQTGQVAGLSRPRFMVLFSFVEGEHPDEQGDLTPAFEDLGTIAARCHEHVLTWPKPAPFERLTWDTATVFGPTPTWGNWRDAPEVTRDVATILEKVERNICTRLVTFGKAPDRFNLIHADMRLANVLVADGTPRLIDFDDSGWGWFLYDFAAAISFIEDDPRVPEMKAAWLRGYRSVRDISIAEEREIDTFVMLRRMALLAWIGSHMDAPEPQALAPGFAATTAQLGLTYLEQVAS